MVERTPTHGREGEILDLDLGSLRGEISSLLCVSKEEGVGFIKKVQGVGLLGQGESFPSPTQLGQGETSPCPIRLGRWSCVGTPD